MHLVLDRSGAMRAATGTGTALDAVRQALVEFAGSTTARGIGITSFPLLAACTAPSPSRERLNETQPRSDFGGSCACTGSTIART
jgi:hypothetical protein